MEKAEKLQLTGGEGKQKRRDLDFYPTPPEVTMALLDFLNLPKGITIWEPACGDGAMSDVFKAYDFNVVSTDIAETGYGVNGIDFLDDNAWYPCDAVITNPPFNLSQQFIEKALRAAPIVAMVLKSQYWHARKRYELFNRNPPAYVLPLTWRPDFMNGERGGAPTMEVHWTVWIRGEEETKYKLLARP